MKVIVGSDLHIPFQNKRAVSEFLEFVKVEQPDAVVLNGDIRDCHNFSTHLRDPNVEHFVRAKENQQVRNFLAQLWDSVKEGCALYYLEGNHEHRITKYIKRNAPSLWGLPGLSLPRILGLDEFDFNFIDYGKMLKLDNVYYMHGEMLSIIGGNSVRKHLIRFGRNLVIGHCHRGAVIHMRVGGKIVSGMECGALCSEVAGSDYVRLPDWTVGWGIVIDGDMRFVKSRYQL